MLPHASLAYPEASITIGDAASPSVYVPPAWAVEAAASAPRITATDARQLVALFRAVAA